MPQPTTPQPTTLNKTEKQPRQPTAHSPQTKHHTQARPIPIFLAQVKSILCPIPVTMQHWDTAAQTTWPQFNRRAADLSADCGNRKL